MSHHNISGVYSQDSIRKNKRQKIIDATDANHASNLLVDYDSLTPYSAPSTILLNSVFLNDDESNNILNNIIIPSDQNKEIFQQQEQEHQIKNDQISRTSRNFNDEIQFKSDNNAMKASPTFMNKIFTTYLMDFLLFCQSLH